MELLSQRNSSLNPNAPIFVPRAFQVVEDFSDEWWELVQSSPWFRDYWLEECFEDVEEQPENSLRFVGEEDSVLLPEMEMVFDDGYKQEEKGFAEIVSLGTLKWRRPRILTEPRKFTEKVPKIVNVKVSPRTIQQPK